MANWGYAPDDSLAKGRALRLQYEAPPPKPYEPMGPAPAPVAGTSGMGRAMQAQCDEADRASRLASGTLSYGDRVKAVLDGLKGNS